MKCRTVYPDIFSESEFVLVVITVDGSDVKLYKNGVAQTPTKGNSACAYKIPVNDNPLKLGANHFGGIMKSFAVWDRALSPSEVANLANGRLTCP